MSCCTIKAFKNGVVEVEEEFKNSWGGAAYIWDCLYKTYLKDPNNEFDSWLSGWSGTGENKLWGLHKNKDLPDFMRLVHMATYDNALVYQKDLPQYAKHLREFVQYFGTNGKICHLLKWAEFIENNLDAEAIGFHHTSVCEDPWIVEVNQEYFSYNMNIGSKHWDVFQEFATI